LVCSRYLAILCSISVYTGHMFAPLLVLIVNTFWTAQSQDLSSLWFDGQHLNSMILMHWVKWLILHWRGYILLSLFLDLPMLSPFACRYCLHP